MLLEKEKRDALLGITRKGSHPSQKVINALILLNCDESEFNEHQVRGEAIAETLRVSARKVDRVKKRFVEEGMEAVLGGRQGRCLNYVHKADGEFEAKVVASIRRRATRSGRCGCWRGAWWNSDTSRACRTRRYGGFQKKRAHAVAVGDSSTEQCGLRGGDEDGSRYLPPPLRCSLCGGVHGRRRPGN